MNPEPYPADFSEDFPAQLPSRFPSSARDFPADSPADFPAHPGISQQASNASQGFPKRFPSSASNFPADFQKISKVSKQTSHLLRSWSAASPARSRSSSGSATSWPPPQHSICMNSAWPFGASGSLDLWAFEGSGPFKALGLWRFHCPPMLHNLHSICSDVLVQMSSPRPFGASVFHLGPKGFWGLWASGAWDWPGVWAGAWDYGLGMLRSWSLWMAGSTFPMRRV